MSEYRVADRRPRLIIVLAVLVVAVAAIGFFVYRAALQALRAAEGNRLASVAEMKARYLGDWLAERRADARVLAMQNDVIDTIAHGGPHLTALAEHLEAARMAHAYSSIIALDAEGRRLFAVGQPPAEASPSHTMTSEALRAEEPYIVDLHVNPGDGALHFAVMVAVRNSVGATVGALVINIDPNQFLLPLVQQWPGTSATAETLLLRQDGGNIAYLNRPRHGVGLVMPRLPSLGDQTQIAVQAISATGTTPLEGIDYRGNNVLGAARGVEGMPWQVLVKIDKTEVFSSLQDIAGLFLASLLGVILLAGMATDYLWRRQRQLELDARDNLEYALGQAESMLRVALDQTGFLPRMPSSADLRATLEPVVGRYADLTAAVGLTFETSFAPGVRIAAESGPLIGDIADILLGNALRFTSHGGICLTTTADSSGEAIISVADTGRGIGPEEQTTIFEDGAGTLASCRQRLADAGGRIWLLSAPGLGTTIFYSLPCVSPSLVDGKTIVSSSS